ncbi:flagellar motor protein MotD [Massilia sp. PAMC28688]|uniref:flagellar motor protein MotD n=1 Tax=Massilia sp. PAMC28688 TaxID=2861283 RepID=UPI001C63A14B|nr:flagellar motor protein MotD [Massilia sp. PAMC28688]QYF91999.1 flagellar motor protein MotD [Massilia sp. PAMC28688]
MARKKYEEEHENHERWLISYADFITLLFAFFVVMYAISSVNEAKYKVFAESLGKALSGRGAVNVAPTTAAVAPAPTVSLSTLVQRRRAEALRREREVMRKLAVKLADTLAPLVKEGKVRVTQSSRGVSVEINASVLFDPGDATLARESDRALRALAVLLRDDPHAIQVEGHTDTTPISSGIFQSNWELSAVRASSVIRLFNESGVDASRLTAVGHAANVPAASNDTQEGRARNRRVTVMILSALPDTTTEISAR